VSETSLIFNLLAKDRASQAFNQLKLNATHAFDMIATKAFNFAKSSVHAFMEAERGELLLSDAFAKFPPLADTNIERLRELNSALELTTRFDDEATAAGQAKLAMFKLTGAQITALTPLMQDFAAKTGGDVTDAATAFGRAILGQGRGLKQVGINFKDTGSVIGNYNQLMDQLTQKVGGFAVKEGKTATGQAKILDNQFGELKETIGAALVPALVKLVPPLVQILGFLRRNSDTVIKVLAVVGSLVGVIWLLNAAVRAYTAVQIAWNIAMELNPIGLIIIAVIALVAGIYLLWTRSSAFRNFFIGMWDHIWGFLKAVGGWFAGPFAGFFVKGYRNAMEGLHIVVTFVKNWWDATIALITGMPGRIRRAAAGMWDGIKDAFRSVINWLIDRWNHLEFKIPSVSFMGQSVGGFTLGVPDIPRLDRGGYVTATGLAVVHRGETVTPARATPRAGGRVEHTITFAGHTDSAFAVAFQKLMNSGLITVDSKWVRG